MYPLVGTRRIQPRYGQSRSVLPPTSNVLVLPSRSITVRVIVTSLTGVFFLEPSIVSLCDLVLVDTLHHSSPWDHRVISIRTPFRVCIFRVSEQQCIEALLKGYGNIVRVSINH